MRLNRVSYLFAALALMFTSVSSAEAATLTCGDLPIIFRSFERQHYSKKSLDDQTKQNTIAQFIKMLDPSKTLLLEKDVAMLQKELGATFSTMQAGDCSLLDNSYDLIIARAKEDLGVAKELLGPKYKIDETIQIVTDPDKRAYAKTNEERAARVREMLHFQMSNYLVTGMDLAKAKQQLVHRYELVNKRLAERKEKHEMPEMFAEAFATALDPHSSFMSADTLADFQIQMRLSLEGIGAVLSSQDGFTVIESLVPGGQAERAKVLRPKDKIVAVTQAGEQPVTVIDMDLQDVVKMIRGKKGTKVTLTVLRDSEKAKSFDVTIVRDKIDVSSQAAKITYETRDLAGKKVKLGVIDLPSFYGGEEGGRSCSADVRQLLDEAKQQNVDGIVLDLSKNGGGLLEEAVRIAGLFIKRGNVVATKDAAGRVEVLADQDDGISYTGPLVVLVSSASASASEILAGALQDYRRAVVVGGERTFGKGSVQLLTPLPRDLGALKVTTGMFFLPGGKSTQQLGVPSDVRIPSLIDGYDLGEKDLDYSLPQQSIARFTSDAANGAAASDRWLALDDAAVTSLGKRSQERIQKEQAFNKIKEQLLEVKKNRGTVKLADLRKKAKDGLDDAESDQFKALEGAVQKEAVNVLYDLLTLRRAAQAGL